MLRLVAADADADMMEMADVQLPAVKYMDSEPPVQMIQDIVKHVTELHALRM